MIKKLTNKYSLLPIQVKATFWFTVCSAVQSGCKFFTMPILIRLLTSNEYGIYSVFLSWIQIISIFATLKLDCGVYNNAMLKYHGQRDIYTASSQSISITATAICTIIYFAFAGFWNSLFGIDPKYTVLIFIQLCFTEGYLLWSARQRYEYRYIKLLVSTVIFSVLYMIIPVAAAFYAPAEQRLDAVIYSGSAVQILFGAVFMIGNYLKGKCFFNRKFWKYSIGFNIPLIPHYLSGIVLGQSDRIMIKNISGESKAGIYSFTYNISLVINIVATAVNSAIVPFTYENLKSRDFKKLRSSANFILIMIGSMILLFSAVAPEFIKLFATEEYYEAIYIVPIISLSSYYTFMQCLWGNIEFYFEENKFITVASTAAALANIGLNALLIPCFGYFAAGCTTLLCYMVSCFAHFIFFMCICKKHGVTEKIYDYRIIILITFVVTLSVLAMLMIYDYPLIRYFILIAGLAAMFVKRKLIITNLLKLKEKKI